MGDHYWRCTKHDCPDPDYPVNMPRAHSNSARGTAHWKCTLHGYKYHHKQVTASAWSSGGTEEAFSNALAATPPTRVGAATVSFPFAIAVIIRHPER
ncbi:hypothetical protein BD626DRAFT_629934 [Schizophyllum amplum]|uniref:Uncharacterized protein n=1 Tax=Schizophyllum amplum TaxID=97359 RepID=A0A550CF02_9AGAR|nr:hypothetical protein BD626DRAFT_629934 [Auriculariopsis ampla]